jgi:hypothetical protein
LLSGGAAPKSMKAGGQRLLSVTDNQYGPLQSVTAREVKEADLWLRPLVMSRVMSCVHCAYSGKSHSLMYINNTKFKMIKNEAHRELYRDKFGYKRLYFKDFRAGPRIRLIVHAKLAFLAGLHTPCYSTTTRIRCHDCTSNGYCTDSAYSGSSLFVARVCYSS